MGAPGAWNAADLCTVTSARPSGGSAALASSVGRDPTCTVVRVWVEPRGPAVGAFAGGAWCGSTFGLRGASVVALVGCGLEAAGPTVSPGGEMVVVGAVALAGAG